MKKTMIQIKKETREKIKSLGKMSETYVDVIQRMYDQTVENMLVKQLLDTSDSVPLEKVLRERKLI